MMVEKSSYIYLDYAASSPLCQAAIDAMSPWLTEGACEEVLFNAGMNPNSLHTPGRCAFKSLEASRKTLAEAIGAKRPSTVYFTSGATEADNAALFGIARAVKEQMRLKADARKCKVVTSAIEHDAVLKCLRVLKREGFETEIINPNRDGFIEVRELEAAFSRAENEQTRIALVSIQTANSEIGSIQPIKQLCSCAQSNGAFFHTDATQALGKISLSVEDMGVDAASFSSHKIAGPRGIGALFLKKDVPFEPLLVGGGQESAMRSGTQDVCSAAGFAASAKDAVASQENESARLMAFRDKLYADLSSFDGIQPTVEVEQGSQDFLPNIVNVVFDGLESDTLVARYDSLGFAVSGASACSSGSLKASHVLTSLGMTKDEALGELRVSMGKFTTASDINSFLHATHDVLKWKS